MYFTSITQTAHEIFIRIPEGEDVGVLWSMCEVKMLSQTDENHADDQART